MKGTEKQKNDLAAEVARVSRIAGTPINAYHARADIDEWLNRGLYLRDLPGLYSRHYGVTVSFTA